MPRVTMVNKARKAQGTCGKCGAKIKKGDSYRWWRFRYGGRRVRCAKSECRPKPSDLTQSAFYGTLYDIQDSLEDAVTNRDADGLRSAADELRNLGEECSSNRDNMPEGLQDSETGELLQTRAEECESRADELESAADEIEGLPDAAEWKEYVENENVEKQKDESDEDFEARVKDLIESEINSAWESFDADVSID